MASYYVTKTFQHEGTGYIGGSLVEESELPADAANWKRVGLLILADESAPVATSAPTPGPAAETVSEPDPPSASAPPVNWLWLPVSDLEVEGHVVDKLQDAGLKSIKALLEYGKENNGFTELKGIGEATDKEIRDAVSALKDAHA